VRKLEDWMELTQEEIDDLLEEDWIEYQNKKCLCFSHSKEDCICGAWWVE